VNHRQPRAWIYIICPKPLVNEFLADTFGKFNKLHGSRMMVEIQKCTHVYVYGDLTYHVHVRGVDPSPHQLIPPIPQDLHLTFDMLVSPAFLKYGRLKVNHWHKDYMNKQRGCTINTYLVCQCQEILLLLLLGESLGILQGIVFAQLHWKPYALRPLFILIGYKKITVPWIEYSNPHTDFVTGLSMLFRVGACILPSIRFSTW
jgi:hypothetical protein